MTDLTLFAALDVSLEKTTICVMALDGAIVREEVVATEPEAIGSCLMPDLPRIARIGLEAGPMSEWLVRGLAGLGLDVVLMETRQVRGCWEVIRACCKSWSRCSRLVRPCASNSS